LLFFFFGVFRPKSQYSTYDLTISLFATTPLDGQTQARHNIRRRRNNSRHSTDNEGDDTFRRKLLEIQAGVAGNFEDHYEDPSSDLPMD